MAEANAEDGFISANHLDGIPRSRAVETRPQDVDTSAAVAEAGHDQAALTHRPMCVSSRNRRDHLTGPHTPVRTARLVLEYDHTPLAFTSRRPDRSGPALHAPFAETLFRGSAVEHPSSRLLPNAKHHTYSSFNAWHRAAGVVECDRRGDSCWAPRHLRTPNPAAAAAIRGSRIDAVMRLRIPGKSDRST